MKSKQIMLILFAAVCGILAAVGIMHAMANNNSEPAEPKVPEGPIVVAVEHLDIKTKLTEENVRLEQWPVNLIPEGASTDLEMVHGKVITQRLSKGQAIIQETIFDKFPGPVIPPGHQVINLKVPPEDVMAGLMNPGDRVNVIGIFKSRDPRTGRNKSETLTFLRGIRVFNIGSRVVAHESKESGRSSSGIVGVLVTERQSEKIVHARKNGQIRLALVGDEEVDEEFNDSDEPLFPSLDGEGEEVESQIVEVAPPNPLENAKKMVMYVGDQSKTVYFDRDTGEIIKLEEGGASGSSAKPRLSLIHI